MSGLHGPVCKSFDAKNLSAHFCHGVYLKAVCEHLDGQAWLESRYEQNQSRAQKDLVVRLSLSWEQIVERGAQEEFAPLCQDKDDLINLSRQGLCSLQKQLAELEERHLEAVRGLGPVAQKDFLKFTLQQMRDLFTYEDRQQRLAEQNLAQLGPSLYRSFDHLDQVLGLTYQADYQMTGPIHSGERLYEGAGPGVQSGYSTILLAIAGLDLRPGDRWIDLGSGYGRVGFLLGLLRPDVDFLGYEYVDHRVQASNEISQRWGLIEKVVFRTQDLSDPAFQIPMAQVYYLYDPFSESTYLSVLAQLQKISRKQRIVIITKGNARAPLVKMASEENWPPPQEYHGGNLCLFHSGSTGSASSKS